MLDPVRVELVVPVAQDRAFAGFAGNMASWWPLESHSISASRQGVAAATVTVDGREGGQIVERAADGATHVWGQITVWDPPRRLDFSWYVGRTPDQATHVSVWFDPVDDGRTGVTLVHSNWEVLDEAAADVRGQYDGGWQHLLGVLYAGSLGT